MPSTGPPARAWAAPDAITGRNPSLRALGVEQAVLHRAHARLGAEPAGVQRALHGVVMGSEQGRAGHHPSVLAVGGHVALLPGAIVGGSSASNGGASGGPSV